MKLWMLLAATPARSERTGGHPDAVCSGLIWFDLVGFPPEVDRAKECTKAEGSDWPVVAPKLDEKKRGGSLGGGGLCGPVGQMKRSDLVGFSRIGVGEPDGRAGWI